MLRGDGRLNHDLLPGEKGPQDACGVFGVWAPGEEVAKLTYFGLYALGSAVGMLLGTIAAFNQNSWIDNIVTFAATLGMAVEEQFTVTANWPFGAAMAYDWTVNAIWPFELSEYLGLAAVYAALVVTADHGQVDVGDNIVMLDADVLANVSIQSGEGRFRWLHALPGAASPAPGRAYRAPGAVRRRRRGRAGPHRCAAAERLVAAAVRLALGEELLVGQRPVVGDPVERSDPEVRRCQAAGLVLQTMGDQALQLTEVGGGQIGHRLGHQGIERLGQRPARMLG